MRGCVGRREVVRRCAREVEVVEEEGVQGWW